VRGLTYKIKCIAQSTQVEESKRTYNSPTPITTFGEPAAPLKIADPLTTKCVSFTFNNTDATDAIKDKVLSYAHTQLTNGVPCAQVVDSRNKMVDGVVTRNDTTCVKGATPSARLRFLSGNRFSRFLQNNTNNTNNTNTTNGTNTTPQVIPTFVYNVCTKQDL